jgi:molecular chaperone DnaJ
MKLKEAYAILEIPESSTPEEAKKQYKKLTKEFHPDINKSPDAEAKFKKINEAYECVKSGKGNERDREPPPGWSPFVRQQHVVKLENVDTHLTIDFKESVLGCKKEIKYSRKSKCSECDGAGEVHIHNGCTKCGGRGQVTIMQRGMMIVSTCPQCHGQDNTEDCKSCKAAGSILTDVSVHISVPAGVLNGNTLRLQGMGNYAGTVMGIMDQYTDAFCHVTVTPEEGLRIEGRSVISILTLPLLEAIRGCQQSVKTIYGLRNIQVPPQSRNRDEVIIPHCGVGGTGEQKVVLDVQYPKNTDRLIGVLLDEVI